MPKYVTYTVVKQVYGISSETVRNWAKRDQIGYRTIQNDVKKTWLYDLESIGNYLGRSTEEIKSEFKGNKSCVVIYTRVSSNKQSSDLERQKQVLQSAFPDAEIISDIGSGINYKRPGLSKLVKRICRNEISQVVVTYKDRIMRFGFELFEQICQEHGTKILVYCKKPDISGSDDVGKSELEEDLLSIINVFVAKNNGKRAAYLRNLRKGNLEDQNLSEQVSETETK